jgi:lysyl-tRNA synthetase class 2
MSQSRLQHIRQERLNKVEELKKLGINPYPAQSKKDKPNQDISLYFQSLENQTLSLTGRVMAKRDHGQLNFIDLTDFSGTVQLYFRSDTVKPTDAATQIIGFDHLNLIDVGDFVEARGTVTKTQRGEISLLVQELRLLTKSLRPLPDKHDALSDPELIFRRRYLDLITSPEHRNLFSRKSQFWAAARKFMLDYGFMEVETPVLEHVTGGADARPFVTHMNALDQDFFMRISTELYQKRLIGGGFEKIFTLGPNFRNEGLSDEHLSEYYQLEWYWAYADYEANMKLVEALYKYIAQTVYSKSEFASHGHTFNLNQEWPRISYPDIIKEKLGVDIFTASDDEMLQIVKSKGVALAGAVNRNRLIDNLWKIIRKDIAGPAFLINEPKFMSPLAKSKSDRPDLTERFHVIIAGSELGNGYSELNDPLDQLARFQEQQAARDQGDEEAQMLDIDFVEMLEYGMPPTSGFGMSERVFWFLEGVTAREGTLFPALKHKIDPVTEEIYKLKS